MALKIMAYNAQNNTYDLMKLIKTFSWKFYVNSMCCYAECHHADCRGASQVFGLKSFKNNFFLFEKQKLETLL